MPVFFNCDILVFSGGEDISPSRYGFPEERNGWVTPERDELEFRILGHVLINRIRAKKVLGICRGHQLLNVGFGGTLVQDIQQEFGESHSAIHPLTWFVESPLKSFLPVVNSMHHQGIMSIGRKSNHQVLAVEPRTQLIEAISWSNKFLGVQFHPESLSDSLCKQFCRVMERWVSGEINMDGAEAKPSAKYPKKITADFSEIEQSLTNFSRVVRESGVTINNLNQSFWEERYIPDENE
jgi:putative glutamine amidotransferase